MTEPVAGQPAPRWALLTTGLLSLPLLLALPPLVYLGRHVRPASDDWCLLPIARLEGFTGVVGDIYLEQNGRFFNAVANAAAFTGYPVASKLLPGLVLLSLVALLSCGAAMLVRRALHADPVASRVGGVTAGTAVVLAMLIGKPAEYQTLFHTPTIISHTLPIMIAAALCLAVILSQRRGTWQAGLVGGVGGLVLGTFNEAFTAVTLVSVATLAILAWLKVPLPVRLPAIVATGFGILGGFASVVLSAGSRSRQENIKEGAFNEEGLLAQTFDNWLDVLGPTTSSATFVLLVAAGLLVGALLVQTPVRAGFRTVVVPVLWAAASSFAACFVYSYAFNGRLVLRERIWPSMTISVLLVTAWLAILAGVTVAAAVRRLPRPVVPQVTTLLILLVLGVAGVRGLDAAHSVRALEHDVKVRAVAFDAAERDIRRQLREGVSPVRVQPVPIDGLYEPFHPRPRGTWPSRCLPDFYGEAVYERYPNRAAP